MTSHDIRRKYIEFFKTRGHQEIPSASLVPENDPTTLFTSAGMQPMIPYLLGEKHPKGDRIVDSQKCFRSQDIEEVGDNRHQTFFEMLGNWSLGDYFKKEQLGWIFEFLTDEVGLDPKRLYVTSFMGDDKNNLPKDTETVELWKKLFSQKGIDAKDIELGSVGDGSKKGMQEGRIFYYDATKNWWSRSGFPENMPSGEPGGPDSEIFYEFDHVAHLPQFGEKCHPNCDCGRFLEIGNSVFMQYVKQDDGSFKELPNKSVDFGGGLERITAVSSDESDVFKTDSFWSIIERLQDQTGIKYESNEDVKSSMRIVADHIKAATFLVKDGVLPGNKLQGYALRRLLRRAAVKAESIKKESMNILPKLIDPIIDIYQGADYFQTGDWDNIRQIIEEELGKFKKTINTGFREIQKIDKIDGKIAFDLYQTFGFPVELTAELAKEKGLQIDLDEFKKEFEKHRELSRTASAGMFRGGLADHSEQTTKLHTATHLMYRALKNILGEHVIQRGSNINPERLRFDFSHPTKVTPEQIKEVEEIVNEQIQKDIPVHFEIFDRDAAMKTAAGAFGEKYPEKVKVYFMGDYSKEICGGPHVEHTGILGHFKILKEESASAGIRRIYATVGD